VFLAGVWVFIFAKIVEKKLNFFPARFVRFAISHPLTVLVI